MKRTTFFTVILTVGLAVVLFAENNCYTVLAGRGATEDGSVMMAHNEDNGIQYVARMKRVERVVHPEGSTRLLDGGGSIPEADTSWAYWILEMPGLDFSHALVNEKSVAVASDNCPSREDRPELVQGGIGRELRILVAERARSAREGASFRVRYYIHIVTGALRARGCESRRWRPPAKLYGRAPRARVRG